MKTIIAGALGAAAILCAFNSQPAQADPSLIVPITSCPGMTVTGSSDPYFSNTGGTIIAQYVGIRYAQSPAAANRWKAPKPYCLNGSYDATLQPWQVNTCPQGNGSGNNEDCLFLNIYRPWNDDTNLPVMVFIHGGALQGGASTFQTDPTDLVSRGVIVVTINYRLGALGFLAHPALDNATMKQTGNYGILDQQAALKWVKKNIGPFGGNTRNITIFGQSAGGLSVLTHLISPLSKGLYNKAIIESGALYQKPTLLSDAETGNGLNFASAVGCPQTNKVLAANCLRGVSVSTILANQSSTLGSSTALLHVDDVVIPKDENTNPSSGQYIKQLLIDGRFNKVPVINGTNRTEQRFNAALNQFNTGHNGGVGSIGCNFVSDVVPDSEAGSFAGAMTFHTALGSGHGNFNGSQQTAIENSSFYKPRATEMVVNTQFTQVMTDVSFACRGFRTSKYLSLGGSKTWYYEFDDELAPLTQSGPYKLHNGQTMSQGAYHGSELQYLFPIGNSAICGVPNSYAGLTLHQRALASYLVTYWTNFAKTSNPSLPVGDVKPPLWQRFDGTNSGTMMRMVLNKPARSTAQAFDDDHHCTAFWDTITQ